MKQCNMCFQWKEEEEFNWRWKALGIRQPACRECHKILRAKWYESYKEQHRVNVHARKKLVREEAREFIYQYLLEHPCEMCGESDPMVLEFHHLEGKDKTISE